VLEQKLCIVNTLGLHARAAAKLVKLSTEFNSQIQLKNAHREADAKSIMSVMMLAAAKGTHIDLCIEGNDEIIAMKAIKALIKAGFGENA
jgi:phosphocarrier protein